MTPRRHSAVAQPGQLRVARVVLFCALLLLALVMAVTVLASLLIRSFEQVETADLQQKATQLARALDADLRQLAVSNRDYAEWDEAFNYIQTFDPHFISANFTRETLSGMRVDVVWMVDRDGHEIYSCFFDREHGTISTPAPRDLLRPLSPFVTGSRLAHLAPSERIVTTDHGLAGVAATQIKRTSRSDPTGAVLIFGRLIADPEIHRVGETTQLPILLTPLQSSAATTRLPQSVREWASSREPHSSTLVYAPDHRQISAYSLIESFDHRPVALLSTTVKRDIFAVGYRTTWYLVGIILTLAVGLIAAVAWFLIRLGRSLAERRAIESRYRIIGEQLQEGIVLVDAMTHQVVDSNEAVLRALGTTHARIGEFSLTDIFPDVPPGRLQTLPQGSERLVLLSRARRQDRTWMDCEITVTATDIEQRRCVMLVAHDVSHRTEAERRERMNRRKLVRIAQKDPLTGLPNRAYLRTRLPQVLRKLAGSTRLLALIYVDIDHFKNINDSRGHPQGDQLLRTIAQRLRAAVAAHDVVVRMGGDEFVVVAALMPDQPAVEAVAVRLQTVIAAPVVLESETHAVTASMGIAIFPRDGVDAETLLKHADIALYRAKEAGRSCHRVYSADWTQQISENVAFEQALHRAQGTDQFFLEYQPVVELSSGRIMSLEALMRWRHPEQGVIAPGRFIPIAESSGLIVPIGEQALRMVFRQLQAWLHESVSIVPVAVNLSPLQLERMDFAALVEQLSQESGVPTRWLRFEVTESAIMKETERFISSLAALRALGCQVLIDDFGTGYSSLSYLNQLPVDVLKVDRSFVSKLEHDASSLPIVTAILDMAKQLKLTTVAEGVETPEQAALLLELGCDYGQGYLYSKPVSAGACRALLQELQQVAPLTQTVLVRALSLSKAS